MKPADAAAEFWATLDEVEAGKPAVRRHEKAVDVLKKHMVAAGLKRYRGIDLVESPGGDRVDLKLLEAKFPDETAECRQPTVRRALVAKQRPRSAPAAATS